MLIRDGEEARDKAAAIIARGGVVAFRTDTFYGLGADPFNSEGLRKIFELKGRDEGKPILVVISDESELGGFVKDVNLIFAGVIGKHWPGALTVVGVARKELPQELTAGTGTIGVRLPEDDEVRAFVRVCGGALTATSANPSGLAPARAAADVERYFQDEIDLIIDGGSARSEQASSVLDLSVDEPRLLREGVVSREELRRTLENLGAQLK